MHLWTKQLSIGNRVLDSEHKKLYGMIGRIRHAIAAGNIATLSEVFEQMEDCLHGYFAAEERIAQAISFDFAEHSAAHQRFLDEVRCLKDELMTGDCGPSINGNNASRLMDCLIRHIKKDSWPLKIVLDTHLYDFNP